MKKALVLTAVAGALFSAAPASADWTNVENWSFCSGTSLNVCMDFTLTREDGTDNYLLFMQYSSADGIDTGVMTAAGLYQDGTGTGINISDAAINASSGGNWSVGDNGLSGGGQIEIVVAADAQGNNGVGVGGWVEVSFTSDNISQHLASLHARAHVQSFGDESCSLKPDSNLGVVDGAEVVNARCGTSTETVPEPITMILLGSGLLGVGGAGYRKRRQGIEA